MWSIISFALTASALLLAVPVAVFFVEIVASVLRRREHGTCLAPERPNVAVLVPAHNESSGLLPTLADIRAQLRDGDRVLVVADNCTDDTVAVAVAAGAEVVERRDLARIGKAFALDFGLQHLAARAPDVVVIVDADCRVAEGTLDRLAAACAANGRPCQALDLMCAPASATVNLRVAEFAWRVKNWVRPLGLNALGLPCQLMGTGMAFPWPTIRAVSLASGEIVEDLKLGLDLASRGLAPEFCPAARVSSEFASSSQGAESQRHRWEGGHIKMIIHTAPRLLLQSLSRRDWKLLALTLDLAVPPLALLGILVLAMFAIAVAFVMMGAPSTALVVSTGTLAAFMLAVSIAWWTHGRDVLRPRAIWAVVTYVLRKFPLYRRILAARDTKWVRTDRTKLD